MSDGRKLIYLDEVFTQRGAVESVLELFEDLAGVADEGLLLASDPVRHRAELQEIATQAKEAVKDLEVNLLILEAIETGRVKSVPAEGGGEILEIDEDLIVERLSD